MPPARRPSRTPPRDRKAAATTPAKRSATPAKRSSTVSSSKSPVDLKTWQLKAVAAAKQQGGGAPHPNFEFEFGGIPGAAGIIIVLPLVIFLLFFGCDATFCVQFGSIPSLPKVVAAGFTSGGTSLWSWTAAAVVTAWMLLHFLLYLLLPGPVAEGVQLPNGTRLKYKITGHRTFWLCLVACYWLPLPWLYDHYLELATASMVVSLSVSVFCYLLSFRSGELLAVGGVSGNPMYDFFIGRALNPRVGDLDLKYLCELRPGLIGWVVLNLGCAAKQYELTGSVSAPMACVNAFQMLYVWDAVYNERAILTTMDITTDGFGFMLAFGDLSWVPFTYSLQARLLVEHDPRLSTPAIALVAALNALGFAIFRGANSEKDAFRRDPNAPAVAHLEFMETKRGTRLLTSGWWGLARKINYTGDWCMGLAWCLCCGAISPIAYFYAIYFFVLLVHRSMRDDHACSLKYGPDWLAYKARVPSLFVPGIW